MVRSSKVWDVLTSPMYTSEWAPEFSGGAEFLIESDWELGSPVHWKGQDGNVIVFSRDRKHEAKKLGEFLRQLF